MKHKYYISTVEDSEVKAYCIMRDDGFIMKCNQRNNDIDFFEEVEKFSKYYNCVKIEEPVFNNVNKKHIVIPHITTALGNYFKTEKGKECLLNYIEMTDALDYELIDELMNFTTKKK